MRYLDCEDDAVFGDHADGAHALLDGFDRVLDLEQVAVRGEDRDG